MTRVRIATWNIGNRGTWDDLSRLMYVADVIALQEAGDRRNLLEDAEDLGWTLIRGKGQPGQDSTPLLVSPAVRVGRPVAWPLIVDAHERTLGRGAGPSTVKPKWAIGARMSIDGVRFGVVNKHAVASQQHARRENAARMANERLMRRLKFRPRPWFICADENEDPDDRHDSLKPIYLGGYGNPHLIRDLPTHGRRAIDYVWHPRKRADIHSAVTLPTKSDHHALIVTYTFKRRFKKGTR